MMKYFALILIVVAIIFSITQFVSPKKNEPVSEITISNTVPSVTEAPVSHSQHHQHNAMLFVPYWNASVDRETYDEYDRFIYFGVAVTKEGSIVGDEGKNQLQSFTDSTKGKTQLLTVRMLDTEDNLAILEDQNAQESIIAETTRLASEYHFDGIVLDLELSALPFSDLTSNINVFVQKFAEESKNNDLHFAITMYGDAYFRGRPFDIKSIGKSVDEIMIMTYDFHKSRGEPGPNFPLNERTKYGYDFETMIKDFSRDVHADKLSVILGMYGYDWTLGHQGLPLKAARALPLTDIKDMIEPSCDLKKCSVKRNNETSETQVKYIDDENYSHELWFEDEESAEKKIEYLEGKGIENVGYWVYGYW